MRIRRRRRGFSLIELLMVVGIILIILALLMPALAGGRDAARSVACRNNLKQIGLALHVYQNLHEKFPIGYVARKNPDPLKSDPGWGWQVRILPHMEQSSVYGLVDFSRSIADSALLTVSITRFSCYVCPADRETGEFTLTTADGKKIGSATTSSYVGCYGAGGDITNDPGGGNGFFVRNKAFALDNFQDGLSSTFAVGERAALFTKSTWAGVIETAACRITPGAPTRSRKVGLGAVQILARVGDKPLNSPDSDPEDFFSPHVGGGHFLMGDGSVRFVRKTIRQEMFRAYATRAGGEMIGGIL